MITLTAPLLPWFEVRESDVSVGLSTVRFVISRKERVTLLLPASNAVSCTYGTRSTLVAGRGVLVAVNGTPQWITFATHGALVTYEWFVIASAASTITALEVMWYPDRATGVNRASN